MSKIVEVEVTEHKANGILVKVLEDDNRMGRIRFRELSWDRSVRSTPPLPEVGKKIKAKIIRKARRYVDLSIRQLRDPWEDIEEKYREGQIIRGEVVNVRNFGVFVQLEPGVDAMIHPEDIPLRPGQLPHTVLSVGDQVEAVINKVDLEKREIDISLTKRLLQLSTISSNKKRIAIQLDLLGESIDSKEFEKTGFIQGDQKEFRKYYPPIPRPERILIVDDDEKVLGKICEYLEEKLDCETVGVQLGKEAVRKAQWDPSFGLAVIDLTLEEETGRQVAQKILQRRRHLPILFTSGNSLPYGDHLRVNGRKFLFVKKELEEISEAIEKMCAGYWETIDDPDDVAFKGQGSFLDQLGMSAFAQRPLEQILIQILSDLSAETQATWCMVLEVDSVNKAVSMLAVDPPLKEAIKKSFLDGLYYSPVQDVVEDELNFHKKNIWERNKRFNAFRPLFPFKACFGVPVKIPGFVTRHALFLLEEQRTELEPEDFEQTRLAAKFIQVALERDMLLKYMHRYEKRYSHGQLLDSFVHELANKLDGLGGRMGVLDNAIKKAKNAASSQKRLSWLSDAEGLVVEISDVKREMDELAEAYQSVASGKLESVNANEVMQRVRLKLRTMASDHGSTIHLMEHPHLPPARTIQSRLEQVITNLIMNAIQQIAVQSESFENIREERPSFDLVEHGQVILQTKLNHDQSLYPIQIFVVDTGPGIHYQQQESIFLLDTTSRQEGHGMGLYHSRNLIETMGGRIRLVDSLMFIGSAFVIELPEFQENKD